MDKPIIYKDEKGLYTVSYTSEGTPFKVYCDENGNPIPTKKKKNKYFLLISSILLGTALACGGYFAYLNFIKPTTTNIATTTEKPQNEANQTAPEENTATNQKLSAEEVITKAIETYETAPKIKLEESSSTHNRTVWKENNPNYLYKDIVSYTNGSRFETYIKDKIIHTFDTVDNKWEKNEDSEKFNLAFSASGLKPILDYKADYKLEENENSYILTFEPKDIDKFNKILYTDYDYDEKNFYKKYSQIITIDKNTLFITQSVYNTIDYEDDASSTTQVYRYDDKETITFPEQVK